MLEGGRARRVRRLRAGAKTRECVRPALARSLLRLESALSPTAFPTVGTGTGPEEQSPRAARVGATQSPRAAQARAEPPRGSSLSRAPARIRYSCAALAGDGGEEGPFLRPAAPPTPRRRPRRCRRCNSRRRRSSSSSSGTRERRRRGGFFSPQFTPAVGPPGRLGSGPRGLHCVFSRLQSPDVVGPWAPD